MQPIRDLVNRGHPAPSTLPSEGTPFLTFQEEMNRLFDRFYNGANAYLTDWDKSARAPAVNIAESDGAYRVEVELPGLAPESVDVSIAEGQLTVKGEKKDEKEERE